MKKHVDSMWAYAVDHVVNAWDRFTFEVIRDGAKFAAVAIIFFCVGVFVS